MSRQCKKSLTPEEQIDYFGAVYKVSGDSSPSRGRHFCKFDACNWNVSYSYMKRENGYVILDNNNTAIYHNHFCLTHNHPVNEVLLDGKVSIENEADLTSDEMKSLRVLAFAYNGMPSIQQFMNTEHSDGKKTYSKQLLHRVVAKIRKVKFGLDEHRIDEFMKMGRHLNASGGNFDLDIDETFRIKGTRFQTKRQALYFQQYGSYFVEVDGMYSTNKYGLTLMPWIAIDCLGIGHIVGSSTGLSENIVDVVAAGTLFGAASNVSIFLI